ncbi:MAG: TonB-dependent receptor domain-containing protein [bacterium]
MQIRNRLSVIMLVCLLAPVGAFAQNKGEIKGRVTDQETGDPLIGANVTIVGTALGAATDRHGAYRISRVPPGRCTLRASMIGFQTVTVKEVQVNVQEKATVDFVLAARALPLDEIVVTATRTEKLLKDVPATTEIVSREEIEESGAEDISEILEEKAGIRMRKSEGHGWGVQMQGLDAEYVLVLVDGEEIIGRTAGLVDLRQIPIESIDHIEIVKGAASSLYGSEAMGGVINIITKTASAPLAARITTTFGTHDKKEPRATLEFKQHGLSGILTASRNLSDGFDMDKSDVAHNGSPYEKTSVTGKFTYDLSSNARLTFSGYLYDETYRPVSISRGDVFDAASDEKRKHGSLALNWKPDALSNVQIKFYASDYDRDTDKSFRTSERLDQSFEEENQIRGELVFSRLFVGKHLLTVGLDAFRETLEAKESSTVSTEVNETPHQSENTKVVYLQDEIQLLKPLTLVVGGRLDHHSAFGSHISPKVNLHYKLSENVSFRGSYGQGFRAPSIKDLHRTFINFAHGYQVLGNTDLQPETSTSVNFGADFRWRDNILGKVNVFRNDLHDAIRANFDGMVENRLNFVQQNIGEAFTEGIETEIQTHFARYFSVSASHAYVWSEDKETGEELLGVSRNTADWKLEFNHRSIGFNANIRGEYEGGWLFTSGRGQNVETKRSPSYVTWDFRASQRLSRYLKLHFGVDNIFDRQEIKFEPRPGREVYGGFSLSY